MDYKAALIDRQMMHDRNRLYSLEKIYHTLPAGNIFSRKKTKGKKKQQYRVYVLCYRDKKDGKRKHKVLHDSETINQLLLKRELKQKLPIIKHNLNQLEKYAERIKSLDNNQINLLLSDLYYTNDPWSSIKERQNPAFPEHLIHKGPRGMFRSKSEVLIAQLFVARNIPFKYESELSINNQIFYPDFIILNSNNERIIWEHCGMITSNNYLEHLTQKLLSYNTAGIHLGKNLILTFDDENGAIDMESISNTLNMIMLW